MGTEEPSASVEEDNRLKVMFQDAWREISWLDRIYLVVCTIPLMIVVVINILVISAAKRLVFGKSTDNSAPIQITQDVYQIYYSVPNEGCYATVIRNPKTKGLLVHSAPPCTNESVLEMEKLGKLEVLVVPSTAHDCHAAAWIERFPSLTVLVHPQVALVVSKDFPVDETYETPKGKTMLKDFGVVDWADLSHNQRFPDSHWMVSIPGPTGEERYLVLAACGFMGERNKRVNILLYYLACVAGLGPRRVTRHFCIAIVKDCAKMNQEWTNLVSRPKVELVIFQHGESMPAARSREWLVTRNPFRNTF